MIHIFVLFSVWNENPISILLLRGLNFFRHEKKNNGMTGWKSASRVLELGCFFDVTAVGRLIGFVSPNILTTCWCSRLPVAASILHFCENSLLINAKSHV